MVNDFQGGLDDAVIVKPQFKIACDWKFSGMNASSFMYDTPQSTSYDNNL